METQKTYNFKAKRFARISLKEKNNEYDIC